MRKSLTVLTVLCYVVFRLTLSEANPKGLEAPAKIYATKVADHLRSVEASAKVLSKFQRSELTHQTLYDFQTMLKPVQYVLVFDKNGDQVAQSYTQTVQKINVSDRAYFSDARNGRSAFWYGPYQSRNAHRASYSHVARLGSIDFNGLLLMVVPIERLEQLCVESNSDPDVGLVFVDNSAARVAGCGADSSYMQDSSYIANFEHGQIVAWHADTSRRAFHVLLFVEAVALALLLGLGFRFRNS